MFLFQKYLLDRGCSKTFPAPYLKGFVVYEYFDKIIKIEIISFFWDYMKGRPSCYSFRKTSSIEDDSGEIFTNHSCEYVPWDKFFEKWELIANDIKKHKNLKIAKTVVEAKNQIWKSFVVTKDRVLCRVLDGMPESFFKSIDCNLNEEEKFYHQKIILQYFQQHFAFIHASWLTYFETNMDDYFCSWFANYHQNHE